MPYPTATAGGPVSREAASRPAIGLSAVYTVAIDPADVGRRVTVRRLLGDGERTGDVVGQLRSWTKGHLTIKRRTGEVIDVDAATIVAARVVAPELSAAALQRQCALDWTARETHSLGPWNARFNDSLNRRSGSALALELPKDLTATLEAVEAFYRARDARPLILSVEDSLVDLALADRQLPVLLNNDVLIATTADLAAPTSARTTADRVRLELHDTPPDRLIQIQAGTPERARLLRELVATGPHSRYASVMEGDDVIATARTTSTNGWCGLTFVEVDPSARRRGIAGRMLRALAQDALERGVASMWLQVERENTAGRALYSSLGFTRHHGYRYRVIE